MDDPTINDGKPEAVIRFVTGAEETAHERLLKKHLPAWVISGAFHVVILVSAILIGMRQGPDTKASDEIVQAIVDKPASEEEAKDLTNPDIGIDSSLVASVPVDRVEDISQTLGDGAALVTFSADKLFGGPQAGVIAGRAELVGRCEQHPLMRALRPGTHVMAAMQRVTLAYLDRRATIDVPFWAMVAATTEDLQKRAGEIITAAGVGAIESTEAVPGAGSAPGMTIPSIGIRIAGDRLALLRACDPPVVARTRDGSTLLDLRTVEPGSDGALAAALRRCA